MMTGVFLLKNGFLNVFFWILKSLTWFLPLWKPPRSHTRCTHLRPCAPIELPSNRQDISGHRFHWNHILRMKILSNICFMFRSFLVVEGRKMFQELVWVASELHGIKRKSFCFTAASSLPPPAGSWEGFGDESQRMINMIELVQCSEPQLKTPTCWSNFWGSHIYFVRPCKVDPCELHLIPLFHFSFDIAFGFPIFKSLDQTYACSEGVTIILAFSYS